MSLAQVIRLNYVFSTSNDIELCLYLVSMVHISIVTVRVIFFIFF